ncbi:MULTISPECIES: YdcF family protein [unclassified Frankia]
MGLSRPRLIVNPFRATWHRVPWWRWMMRAVAAVLLGIMVLAVVTFLQVWWVGREDHRPRSDVLVVLGASQYDGRPSAVLAARLDHVLELYREGAAPQVITVGGKQPGDRYTEGEASATYRRQRGIPPSRVLVLPEGSNTLGSLTAVAGLMNSRHWHTAVLVTAPWHSLRSRTMARDLGVDAVTSPADRGPAVHGFGTQVRYIIREGIGYRWYQLFRQASPPSVTTRAV